MAGVGVLPGGWWMSPWWLVDVPLALCPGAPPAYCSRGPRRVRTPTPQRGGQSRALIEVAGMN